MIMQFSRRGFMGLVLTSAASSTLLSSNAVADALLLAPDVNKYATVIRRARELVMLRDVAAQQVAGTKQPVWEFLQQETPFNANADDLLRFMLDNFDPTRCTDDDITMVMCGDQVAVLDEVSLRMLSEGVVPVAVIVEMIRVHKLPLIAHRMPSFGDFFKRYQYQILHAKQTVVRENPMANWKDITARDTRRGRRVA
jgi:hypothetical protein